MEVHQRHISSDEDRLLELMEHGAGPDKALLDALRDDDSLRQDCMDVLELSSACRRSKEHPGDAGQHGVDVQAGRLRHTAEDDP